MMYQAEWTGLSRRLLAIGHASAGAGMGALNNPNRVNIVIHNYRWRLSWATGEPQYDKLERKVFEGPVITVPALTIASDCDGAAANATMYRSKLRRGRQ
jgi:hypothetical protein